MRILVIEDEPRIIEFIKQGLEQEGFQVDAVSDGKTGLSYALSYGYDAIILDIMLPYIDGYEVCSELRSRGLETPIIMLTARDAVADRVEGLNAGADDYLTKPFAFEELVARIRAVTRRRQSVSTVNTVKIEDMEIDLDRHKVLRAGKEIDLTPKEYKLLEYLAGNKNKVLSRAKIMENVWGFDFDAETNVVDVYIRYLRQKLDDDHDKKLIKTVRGFGYIFGE
jgi:two-component system copper resistance phosphate regulon response regulator CusR